MTLDEHQFPLSEHRREMAHWRDAAALMEKEDAERYRLSLEERDATESVEARESYWEGVMRQQPEWARQVRYDSGPG